MKNNCWESRFLDSFWLLFCWMKILFISSWKEHAAKIWIKWVALVFQLSLQKRKINCDFPWIYLCFHFHYQPLSPIPRIKLSSSAKCDMRYSLLCHNIKLLTRFSSFHIFGMMFLCRIKEKWKWFFFLNWQA